MNDSVKMSLQVQTLEKDTQRCDNDAFNDHLLKRA